VILFKRTNLVSRKVRGKGKRGGLHNILMKKSSGRFGRGSTQNFSQEMSTGGNKGAETGPAERASVTEIRPRGLLTDGGGESHTKWLGGRQKRVLVSTH